MDEQLSRANGRIRAWARGLEPRKGGSTARIAYDPTQEASHMLGRFLPLVIVVALGVVGCKTKKTDVDTPVQTSSSASTGSGEGGAGGGAGGDDAGSGGAGGEDAGAGGAGGEGGAS
jgi:hypothetical protein